MRTIDVYVQFKRDRRVFWARTYTVPVRRHASYFGVRTGALDRALKECSVPVRPGDGMLIMIVPPPPSPDVMRWEDDGGIR